MSSTPARDTTTTDPRLVSLLNLSRFGEIARHRLGDEPAVLVNRPSLVHEVLVTHAGRFENDYHPYAALVGLYRPEGEYALHLSTLARSRHAYAPVPATFAAGAAALPREGEHDLERRGKLLSLQLTLEMLFGLDIGADAERFVAAIDAEEFVMAGHARREAGAGAVLEEIGGRVARAIGLRVGPERTGTDDDPVTIVIRTLLNSYNATGTAFAWAAAALSHRPELQDELRAEAHGIGEITPAKLEHLTLHRRVVDEVLRLWPVAWAIGRRARLDTHIGAHEVARGTRVIVSPFTLHRSADHWDNPRDFRPQRFQHAPKPSTYLPFGAGVRRCPAGVQAPLHLVALLVGLLDGRRVVPGTRGIPVPTALISLRPVGGVWLGLEGA